MSKQARLSIGNGFQAKPFQGREFRIQAGGKIVLSQTVPADFIPVLLECEEKKGGTLEGLKVERIEVVSTGQLISEGSRDFISSVNRRPLRPIHVAADDILTIELSCDREMDLTVDLLGVNVNG